jgi:hypothetical protein
MLSQLHITETLQTDVRNSYPSEYIKASPKPIACLMLECKRPFDVQWGPVVKKTLERVFEIIHQEPLLKDRMLLYFGADPMVDYGSRRRNKKYWEKNGRSKNLDIHEFHDCVDTFIKEHNNEPVYASCASVSKKHLPTLFESMRLLDPGVIILPPRPIKLTEQLVHKYFEMTHNPPSLSITLDTQRICEYICREGGVMLDLYGGFDDRQLEFYIHYRPDLVPLSFQ